MSGPDPDEVTVLSFLDRNLLGVKALAEESRRPIVLTCNGACPCGNRRQQNPLTSCADLVEIEWGFFSARGVQTRA